MSVNRKAVVIYGSTDLWIYWDKADKLRLFYRDISHNLRAKRVRISKHSTPKVATGCNVITLRSAFGKTEVGYSPSLPLLSVNS